MSRRTQQGKQVVVWLVFGMGYLKANLVAERLRTTRSGTTNAHVRDRIRLDCLQRLALDENSNNNGNNSGSSSTNKNNKNKQIQCNYTDKKDDDADESGVIVVSVSDSLNTEDAEPGHHMHICISQKSAKEIYSTLHSWYPERSFLIERIYVDYFRFPSAYLRNLLEPLFQYCLPGLVELKLFRSGSLCVVPNLPVLMPLPLSSHFISMPLSIADHALFQATAAAMKETDDDERVFGALSNDTEVAHLQNKAPFIAFSACLPKEDQTEGDRKQNQTTTGTRKRRINNKQSLSRKPKRKMTTSHTDRESKRPKLQQHQ